MKIRTAMTIFSSIIVSLSPVVSVYAFGGGGPAPAPVVAPVTVVPVIPVIPVDPFASNVVVTHLSTSSLKCVKTALVAREKMIDDAFALYIKTSKAAYAARGASIDTVYGNFNTQTDVQNNVTTTWNTFLTTIDAAQREWINTRKIAWANYTNVIPECNKLTVIQ
jgi:hypothetical protein